MRVGLVGFVTLMATSFSVTLRNRLSKILSICLVSSSTYQRISLEFWIRYWIKPVLNNNDGSKCVYQVETLYLLDEGSEDTDGEDFSRSAILLYGLIHARYIVTSMGMEAMVTYSLICSE